nr:mucin-5AC-like isoform X1 [Dermacentor andersoni]
MYLFFFKCINSFLSNPIVVDTCHNARAIFIIKTTRRAARFCVPSSCKTKEKRSRTEGLTTMKPWVSKNTMTTRQAGAFHGTGSGTTYTAEDTPSASLARAAVSTVPAQDVSLSQLTYSFESGQTIAGPGKTSCERSERQRSPLTKRRACKSEGQLRASPPLLAPRRQPAAPTALETEQHGLPCSHRPRTKSQQVPGLVNVGQRGPTHTTETTLWTAGSSSTFPFIASPSGPWRRCGHSAFLYTVGRDLSSTVDSSATTSSSASSGTSTSSASSSDSARVLPSRVVRVSSKAALAPNTRSCAVDCTRRDVATATDLPPGEHNGNLPGVWMGGRLPLMVGAALLSALLVASAVATTVGITNRQSTTAPGGADEHRLRDAVAGLAATKPLLPGLPYTEYPLRHDPGVPADEAVTDAAWKWPSTASEPVDGDATVEQPAVGYGNASASFVTAENPLEQPFRRSTRPECGVAFYTYCREPRREFVYRASINACLATGDDHPAQLCNRGPNRFASWRECERSCVLAQPPREACLDKTLLLGCRRQDVRTSWWWFDGRACLAWNFPWGGCPANGSAVFPTAGQCTAHCTNPRYPPCAAPRSAPCGSAQLKFPFFAADAPSSAVQVERRCFRLTRRVLESHRCLTGANRFLTKTACELTCKKPPARP